jgi:hypothetical protein
MTADRRVEITVETERLLIIRQRRSIRVWCRECGREVEMVSLQEAEALSRVPGQSFCEAAPADRWHLSEMQEGTSLVCLASLWK